MHLDLDVNTDLWPLELGERFTFALASTLSLDGAPDAGAHTRAWKTQDCHSAHASGAGSLWHALAPHGTPIVASSALAPRSTLKRPRAQAPMTRVISRRCLTSTSTPCTARYTSGSRRSPRRLCACPPCPPPPPPHAPEAGRALPLITSRAPQPAPMTPLSPPAPQRGLRLLRRAADATARQRPAPAPRPVREARPGRPATVACRRPGGLGAAHLQQQAGSGRLAWGAPEVAGRPESLGWPSRVRRRAALLTPGKSWSSTRESTCSCARRHSSQGGMGQRRDVRGGWRLSSALFFGSAHDESICPHPEG